jgi:hypothetical protein
MNILGLLSANFSEGKRRKKQRNRKSDFKMVLMRQLQSHINYYYNTIISYVLTYFNSLQFFAFHQSSTCLGNLLGAILLSAGGISNVVLFIIFTVIGIFGTAIFLALRYVPEVFQLKLRSNSRELLASIVLTQNTFIQY